MTWREYLALAVVMAVAAFAMTQRGDAKAALAFAQERDSLADVALDSAQARATALQEEEAAHAGTLAAFADSTASWGKQEGADSVALVVAVVAAEEAAQLVLERADTETAAAFNVYRQERDAEVALERRGRVRAEGRASSLAVQVGQLASQLSLSKGETANVRTALAEVQLGKDRLEDELRNRAEPWYWKAATGAAVVCVALCR